MVITLSRKKKPSHERTTIRRDRAARLSGRSRFRSAAARRGTANSALPWYELVGKDSGEPPILHDNEACKHTVKGRRRE